MVILGCIPFIEWEEMVVEGGYKKGVLLSLGHESCGVIPCQAHVMPRLGHVCGQLGGM